MLLALTEVWRRCYRQNSMPMLRLMLVFLESRIRIPHDVLKYNVLIQKQLVWRILEWFEFFLQPFRIQLRYDPKAVHHRCSHFLENRIILPAFQYRGTWLLLTASLYLRLDTADNRNNKVW